MPIYLAEIPTGLPGTTPESTKRKRLFTDAGELAQKQRKQSEMALFPGDSCCEYTQRNPNTEGVFPVNVNAS